jgi:hypothetical protein
MSRELRNVLYAVAGLLVVGGMVLAFLPASIDVSGRPVDCGGALNPSGLESLYPACSEAASQFGMWAVIVGLAGLVLAGAMAYMTYFAKSEADS